MVRLTSVARTDEEKPTSMTWDGTSETAARIDAWARNEAGNARFQWRPGVHGADEARTLVEYPPVYSSGVLVEPGDSAVWVVTPVGSVIKRVTAADDSPLRVIFPIDPEEAFAA